MNKPQNYPESHENANPFWILFRNHTKSSLTSLNHRSQVGSISQPFHRPNLGVASASVSIYKPVSATIRPFIEGISAIWPWCLGHLFAIKQIVIVEVIRLREGWICMTRTFHRKKNRVTPPQFLLILSVTRLQKPLSFNWLCKRTRTLAVIFFSFFFSFHI